MSDHKELLEETARICERVRDLPLAVENARARCMRLPTGANLVALTEAVQALAVKMAKASFAFETFVADELAQAFDPEPPRPNSVRVGAHPLDGTKDAAFHYLDVDGNSSWVAMYTMDWTKACGGSPPAEVRDYFNAWFAWAARRRARL